MEDVSVLCSISSIPSTLTILHAHHSALFGVLSPDTVLRIDVRQSNLGLIRPNHLISTF